MLYQFVFVFVFFIKGLGWRDGAKSTALIAFFIHTEALYSCEAVYLTATKSGL